MYGHFTIGFRQNLLIRYYVYRLMKHYASSLNGIVLWVRCEDTKSYIQNLASLGAATILLIGFLTLFEYFFRINIGIDQGLISVPTTSLPRFFHREGRRWLLLILS